MRGARWPVNVVKKLIARNDHTLAPSKGHISSSSSPN